MNSFKQQCIELRRRDFTLPEIVKATGRPKTSVHFHIRNLPLSENKLRAISASNAERARAIARKRRGLSTRLFKKFTDWDPKLVCLVSHLIFDGEIKRDGCAYNNRNVILLDRVEHCMKKIYLLEPKRYLNRLTGVARLSYFNVSLGEYMRGKAIQLLREIATLPRHLKREFLIAFFDDEGCIDYRPDRNHRRIRGYQKKIPILQTVQKLLSDFDIESRIQLPNEVVIAHKANLLKFQREINFSPGVRINGDRPNSVWKQHLEKREILRRAIESYKPVGSNGVHRS
ncbi:MAG: hypothetical protein UY94_C0019G0002 [Parcubacteria group bacterium GW2011_GWA2_56_21]|nr:MAG: hypothetical protein UY94_C0019G0002 [Parcubacteria group bacterium GW2011_GWA2_56_21]